MNPPMTLELYTKVRCSLCDRAKTLLEDAQRRHGFTLEVRDITTSPVWYERYRLEIPVVVKDGEVVLRLRFTAQDVERLFA